MISATMVDPYDAPMTDYIEDADMAMVQQPSENWFQFQHHSSMEEDKAMIDEHGGFQVTSLEVDMMPYEETTEYEMGDAVNDGVSVVPEIADAEVFDASFVSTPQPPQPSVLTVPVEHPFAVNTFSLDAHTTPVQESALHPIHGVEATQAPANDHVVTTEGLQFVQMSTPALPEGDTAPSEPEKTAIELSLPTTVDSPDSPVQHVSTIEQPTKGSENDGEGPQTDKSNNPKPDSPAAAGSHATEIDPNPLEVNDAAQQATDQDSHENEEQADPEQQDEHQHIEQPYVGSPPPILLSLQVSALGGDQPDFALFSPPEQNASSNEDKSAGKVVEEVLVLLQHRPSLFHEPISSVFEALRQEEYFSHLDELVNSEMALNAVDLQLVISEDNIYAREVSLQDLNAMHMSIGLTGPLHLVLQSVYPRFIARYNLLRDQITRLSIADAGDESGNQIELQQNLAASEESKPLEEHETSAPVEEHNELYQTEGYEETATEDLRDPQEVAHGEGGQTVEQDVEEHHPLEAAVEEDVDGETKQNVDAKTDEMSSFHNDDHRSETPRRTVESGEVVEDHITESSDSAGGLNDPTASVGAEEFDQGDEDAEGEDDPDAEGELDEEQTEYNEIEQQHLQEDEEERNGEQGEEETALNDEASESAVDNQHDDQLEGGVEETTDGTVEPVVQLANEQIGNVAITLVSENSTSSLEEDEFGEDFDEEGFDEAEFEREDTDHSTSNGCENTEETQFITISEQDTLEDSQEYAEAHPSEPGVVDPDERVIDDNEEDEFGDNNFDDFDGDLEDPTISGTVFENAQEPTQEDEDGIGSLSHVVHKHPSKRSLDDAEFDFVDDEKIDSSPDPKRTRVI